LKKKKRPQLTPPPAELWEPQRSWPRALIVLALIALGQFILYGPSLVGAKILLPLDILDAPGGYVPQKEGVTPSPPHNRILSDLVFADEPARAFRHGELSQGRLPLWNPRQYAGVPSPSTNFSPFALLAASIGSPRILPWIALLAAFVGGGGMYQFCRKVLALRFWPSAFAAACYPVTGFFVLWQGYALMWSVVWLPWLLLAVRAACLRRDAFSISAVAVCTALALVSGRLDVGGQVVLASGLFGVWLVVSNHLRSLRSRAALTAVGALALGWGMGILLATPEVLPLLEYTKTGSRLARRAAGEEERPPVGFSQIAQVILPECYGSDEYGALPRLALARGVMVESAAGAYAGVLALLCLAPLAWHNRPQRATLGFLACLAFVGLSWQLNVPIFTTLLRLPGLKMMSHNRLVFVTSFAVIAAMGAGLHALQERRVKWSAWHWVPVALLLVGAVWCGARFATPPPGFAGGYARAIQSGRSIGWITDLPSLEQAREWFATVHFQGAALCLLGVAGWIALRVRPATPSWVAPALGALALTELLVFAAGRAPQCDPALYYPPIPALQVVAENDPSARAVAVVSMPANVLQMAGLRDIRGYDGSDPARYVELLHLARGPESIELRYAALQNFVPAILDFLPPAKVALSPVLDMLGVRYVIFRGAPTGGLAPVIMSQDCFVLLNDRALPRVFVPERVEVIAEPGARLARLGSTEYRPAEVAFVEEPVSLPEKCEGTARLAEDLPQHITVAAEMKTPGLLVLTDLWDKGWRAEVNGQSAPILRTNHAVRGVVLPAGKSEVIFRYAPASLRISFLLAALAGAVLAALFAVERFWKKPNRWSSVKI